MLCTGRGGLRRPFEVDVVATQLPCAPGTCPDACRFSGGGGGCGEQLSLSAHLSIPVLVFAHAFETLRFHSFS